MFSLFTVFLVPFLLVALFILGFATYMQNKQVASLEKELDAANTVSIKYINYYNSEFEARTTAQHERDEYLLRLARMDKQLVAAQSELKRLSVSKFKKLDTKRVVATTKKKKRA